MQEEQSETEYEYEYEDNDEENREEQSRINQEKEGYMKIEKLKLSCEVEDLKRQNSEIDEIISSEATEKEQYDDQSLQIQELVLRFKEEIDSYKTGIEIKQEIPQKAQLAVEMKINEVIQTVSSEYTQPKLEEYEKERRKLKRINDELKNEIDLFIHRQFKF